METSSRKKLKEYNDRMDKKSRELISHNKTCGLFDYVQVLLLLLKHKPQGKFLNSKTEHDQITYF